MGVNCFSHPKLVHISGVWHVEWWNLITRVRLIQVGNNRNDRFRYFLGVRVRLIKVSFKENKGNKFGDFGYCPLNGGCPLHRLTVLAAKLEQEFSEPFNIHSERFAVQI